MVNKDLQTSLSLDFRWLNPPFECVGLRVPQAALLASEGESLAQADVTLQGVSAAAG